MFKISSIAFAILILTSTFLIREPAIAAERAATIRVTELVCEDELITSERLARIETEMIRAIATLSVWQSEDWKTLVGERGEELAQLYVLAISMNVRGLERRASQYVALLATQITEITGRSVDLPVLIREVAAISERPSIERTLGGAQAAIKKLPDIPQGLMALAHTYPDSVVTGRQQVEFIRFIQQFSYASPHDRTLAMGVGMPVVLKAVRHYVNTGRLYGYETFTKHIGDAARKQLDDIDVHVVTGILGEKTFAKVAADGPYRTVAALDLLASDPQFRRAFKLSGLEVARRLRALLEPSGVLLILNDFASEPNFTREEALAAGFNIVRWDLNRDMNPKWVDLMNYNPDDERRGQLRGFVLRNGPEPAQMGVTVHERDVKF